MCCCCNANRDLQATQAYPAGFGAHFALLYQEHQNQRDKLAKLNDFEPDDVIMEQALRESPDDEAADDSDNDCLRDVSTLEPLWRTDQP